LNFKTCCKQVKFRCDWTGAEMVPDKASHWRRRREQIHLSIGY
jgi:hypothetical protein